MFTNSTPPTTSSITTLPEVLIVNYIPEATRASDINVNVSDTGKNVYAGVTCEPDTYIVPSLDEFDDILYGDAQETFPDFIFSPFTINVNSDDDDAQMTKGQFKQLTENLDSLLESSKSSSSSN